MSIRRQAEGWIPLLMVSDLCVVALAFVLSSRLRFGPAWSAHWEALLPGLEHQLPLFGLLTAGVLWWTGLYRIEAGWPFRSVLGDALRASVVLVGLTLSLLFSFKLQDVSRLFLTSFFTMSALGVIAVRAVVRQVWRRYGEERQLLVAGSGERAERFLERVRRHQPGVSVVGFVGDPAGQSVDSGWLGTLGDLSEILATRVVDEVAVCLSFDDWAEIDLVARLCGEQGKAVHIPVDVRDHPVVRGRLEELDGLAVLSLVTGPDRQLALALKRLVDLAGALVGLLLMAPVIGSIALAIRWGHGRPVIYAQERVGRHGRRFRLYKFRTMVNGAEDRQAELVRLNERNGPVFKLAADPRVIPLGRWLRRSSLDELPQLWNVMRGEMSLVGPRPPLPGEVEEYDLWQRRRLSMKPGITGLWQVSDRTEPDFARWVEHDLAYIDRWSLWLDVRILARTLRSVLRLEGA